MAGRRFELMHKAIPVAMVALMGAPALGGGTTIWNFSGYTEGEDTSWVSSAATDVTAEFFDVDWQVTTAEITVEFLGLPFVVDVLGDLPPESISGVETIAGPPPTVIFADHIEAPPPPEAPAVIVDLTFGIQADGRGYFTATNIVLGQAQAEIPPFGVVTVDVTAVNVAGIAIVDPRQLGDVNDDGTIGFDDLLIVLGQWGACPAPPQLCPADQNLDGLVGFGDLLIVLGQWGE